MKAHAIIAKSALVSAFALVVGVFAPTAQAAVCNLTTGISAGGPSVSTCVLGTSPGAVFNNPGNEEVIGSGLINPFLTLQRTPYEEGFSTDAKTPDLPLDVKRAEGNNQFTRTFTIGDLGWITLGGTDYFQFFLDVNEPATGKQSLISLLTLKIYDAGPVASIDLGKNDITALSQLDTQGWTKVYDLGVGNSVLLDYNVISGGSGKGFDMEVLVPKSLFSSDPLNRIVFASAFGNTDKKASDTSDAGFEEWWYRTSGTTTEVCPPGTTGTPPDCVKIPPEQIPEPGALFLVGAGLLGLGGLARRRKAN